MSNLSKGSQRIAAAKKLLTDIEAVLLANKQAFKAGSVITQKQMLQFAKQANFVIDPLPNKPKYKDHQRQALQLMAAYTKFNRVLERRGTRIKSRDYYTEFHVLDTSSVFDDAKISRALGKAKVYDADTLTANTNLTNRPYAILRGARRTKTIERLSGKLVK